MRRPAVLAVITLTLLSLIAIGAAGTVGASNEADVVHECAADMPEDFEDPEAGNETIGWFDGFWYDEPLDIDASDGITEDELANLSARTAARLEAMRCLTFEEMPTVEIIDREEFANETAESFEEVTDAERQFDNAQFEGMLLIGSHEDSVEVREADRVVTVGGFYNFAEKRIVVISDDPETLMIDEEILAHELGHALQDQHFNLSRYVRDTMDLDKGKLGVIEGDVHRIENQYLEACEAGEWADECVTAPDDADGNGATPQSWGLWALQFQPYSDGTAFIDMIYQQGGWEAVNELYEDMPRTATHTIYPETYGEFEPENLTVEDRSTNEWERITREDSPDHNRIGQAGLVGMLVDPTIEGLVVRGQAPDGAPITGQAFLQTDDGTAYNYEHGAVSGWTGDRMYAYSNGLNEAMVWKTAWENEAEALQFLEAYEALAEIRGGERVDGYEHTWTFGADSDFDMALTFYPDGDRLWIVTAPTVDDLTDVHGDIELIEEEDDNDDPNGIDDRPRDDPFAPGDDPIPIDDDDVADDDVIPGFGLVAAVLAALSTGYLVRRWRRGQ